MCPDEGMYEPTLHKGVICCIIVRDSLRHLKKMKSWQHSFHRELPGDEDLMDHGLQPGDFVHWKRHKYKMLCSCVEKGHIRY